MTETESNNNSGETGKAAGDDVPGKQPDETNPADGADTAPFFRSLDPQAVLLWRIETLSSAGLVFLLSSVAGGFLWGLTPAPRWMILFIWIFLGLLLLISAVWFPRRSYQSWSYRTDEKTVEIRSGIFWQTSVMIPFSRLQHVDMNRGPLERQFGLASIEIHTAGTRSASHRIPCLKLDTAVSLREKLASAANLDMESTS